MALHFEKLLENSLPSAPLVVAVISKNSAESALIDIACALSPRLACAPVHTWLSQEHLNIYLKKIRPDVIAIDERLLELSVLDLNGTPIVEISSFVRESSRFAQSESIESELQAKLHSSRTCDGPDDQLFTIIPTGGSTSIPKGVMLSRGRWRHAMQSYPSAEPLVHMAFMPLSHITERHHMFSTIFNGGRTAIHSGSTETYFESLCSVSPTILSGVPRIWATLNIAADLERSKGRSLEAALGSRVRVIVSGSSKLDSTLFQFLNREFPHAQIFHSYGSTETGNIQTGDSPISRDSMQFLRLADVASQGLVASRDHKGELLVHRSKIDFLGYRNDSSATESSFVRLQGEALDRPADWFATGDVVSFDYQQDGSAKISVHGRAKFALKLSNGEFVMPDSIADRIHSNLPGELVDRTSLFITSDSQQRVLIAIIAPVIGSHPVANDQLRASVLKACAAAKLEKHEIPAAVIVRATPFSAEIGEVGPAGKLVPHVINANHAVELNDVASGFQKTAGDANILSFLGLNGFVKVCFSDALSIPHEIDERDTTPFGRLCSDSLSSVQLSLRLARSLDVEIRPSELQKMSFADIYQRCSKQDASADAPSFTPHDDVEEFSRKIAKLIERSSPATKSEEVPGSLLLTGATGFLGSFVLKKLLDGRADGRRRVICIVRAKDNREARARVEHALQRPLIEQDNLVALAGSIELVDFGLSADDQSTLNGPIDAIFNCAGSTNMSASYSELRSSNVIAVMNILQLALRPDNVGRTALLHASSTDVTYRIGTEERFATRAEIEAATSRSHSYAQSKLVAEWILSQALSVVPTAILRYGVIAGDTETGFCLKNSIDSLLIRALVQTSSFPVPEGRFPRAIPVDIAAQFMVSLEAPTRSGNPIIVHALDPEPPLFLGQIADALAKGGILHEAKPLDAARWLHELESTRELAVLPFLFYRNVSELTSSGTREIQSSKFQSFLKPIANSNSFGLASVALKMAKFLK